MAGALAVAAVGAWWAGRAGAPPAEPQQPPAAGTNAATATSTPVAAAPPIGAARAGADSGAAAREAAPAVDARPREGAVLDVLVVDGATGQPVPRADAMWSLPDTAERLAALPSEQRERLERDPELRLRELGAHGRSDDAGVLHVPAPAAGVVVVVRAGERYGTGWFRPSAEQPPPENRVVLARDGTLRVAVVDPRGEPAPGVRVDLRVAGTIGRTHHVHVRDAPEADAAGEVVFPHVQRRLRSEAGSTGPAAWTVVAVAGIDTVSADVDVRDPPEEAVRLVLPPTGALDVRITLAGRPVPGVTTVSLGDAASRDVPRVDHPVGADGWTHLPYVPLGRTFVVAPGPAGPELPVAGPVAAGERVVRELPLDAHAFAIAGRVVDGQGVPQAAGRFRLHAVRTGGRCYADLRTDGDGRFVTVLAPIRGAVAVRLESLTVRTAPDVAPPLGGTCSARPLVPGINELGDVALTAEPLVCSGRIVVDDGGDAPRAHVGVQRLHEPGARDERGRPIELPPDEAPRWMDVADLHVATPPGRFEVHGAVPPGRHRLRVAASDEGFAPVPPVEFAVGATDVEVRLQRGCALVANVLLPAGADAELLHVRLDDGAARPEEPLPLLSQQPLRGVPERRAGATAYRWRCLPGGTYTLRLSLPGFRRELATIPDVRLPLPPGGDPRLLAIDLRERVVVQPLTVRWPPRAEDARDRAIVFPQPQPDDAPWHGITLRGTQVLLPAPGADLLVLAEHCRPMRVHAGGEPLTLDLQPWPTLELTVVAPALPDELVLTVFCPQPADQAARREYTSDLGSGRVDRMLQPVRRAAQVQGGTATIELADGVHELRVQVGRRDNRGARVLQRTTPREVVAGAPVTVRLDADELQAAIAALRTPPR